jgi:peroxiredoxin
MVLSRISACSVRSQAGRVHALILAGVAAVAASLALLATIYMKGTPAPSVTLTSIKGEQVGMAALRGRVAVVNFWATDCAACMKEMPDLVLTYERFRGRGLELIAVAMRHDPPNYVLHYAETNRLPFKVALDPTGEHARAFGDVRLTPTTFVIDKRGDIVWRITGQIDFPKLHALLEDKLAESI